MAASRRRRSLLEDDELAEIGGRDETSSGDVCERCGCPRSKHEEGGGACRGCKKGCEEFDDG